MGILCDRTVAVEAGYSVLGYSVLGWEVDWRMVRPLKGSLEDKGYLDEDTMKMVKKAGVVLYAWHRRVLEFTSPEIRQHRAAIGEKRLVRWKLT